MFRATVKWSFIFILGLLIAIIMRIILPTTLEYSKPNLFSKTKYIVIRFYLSITSVIVLEMLVMHLSVSLIYMTTDWLAMLYLPLLIYAVICTYAAFALYLTKLVNSEHANKLLHHHWRRFFEQDDQFWIEIQKELGCCGLEGPRTYLMYLRPVHPTCYTNKHGENILITKGCEDVVFNNFYAVQILAKGLTWFALFLQILTIILYLSFLIQKYVYIIYPNMRRLKINIL